MQRMMSHRVASFVASPCLVALWLVALWLVAGAMPAAEAAGTVTSPNEAALTNALSGGGTVTFNCDGTITLTKTITIASNTTLDATGHRIMLSGGFALRVISVNSGVSLTVRNLTLANGQVKGADGTVASDGTVQDAAAGQGGAIVNHGGILTLINVAFTGNRAQGGAGAFMESADPTLGDSIFGRGGGGQGGALYNAGGTVDLRNCNFAGNVARGGGGGPGGAGRGGAVYNDNGSVTTTHCAFSANKAVGGSGADGDYTAGLPGGSASGGALDNSGGAVSMTQSAFSGNSARGGSGGAGSFHHGGYDGAAGGSAVGGAVHTEAGASGQGALTVSSSTFVASLATGAAGGLASGFTAGEAGGNTSGAGGTAGGGGISVTGGSASLTNCTLSGNSALGGDGVNDGSNTGGDAGNAAGGGLSAAAGTVVCTNCTLADNQVVAGVAQSNTVDLPANRSGQAGSASGGNLRAGGGSVKLQNTIVAYGGAAGNASGPITDGGHNLSSDSTPALGASSYRHTDPLLGPLADNGGPTLTRGLYVGSPAVGHANAATSPATDQRGVARPQGAGDDIGAFEGTITDPVAPTVAVTHPADRAVVRGFNSLQGTATDNSGLAHVDLVLQRRSDSKYWNGTAWVAAKTTLDTTILTTLPGQPWMRDTTLGIPTGANLLDGGYTLSATAFDRANNQRSTTITFTVDKTPPSSVTITAPVNGGTVANLAGIQGQAADNPGGSGIKHVDLILQRLSDNKYWTGSAWGAVSTVLATTVTGTTWQRTTGNPAGANLAPGRYQLVARAYDQAENVIRTLSTFTVAPTPHSLANFPAPARLSTWLVRADTGTVVLRFTGALDAATAGDPQHYAVTVNGQPVAVESAAYDATTHTVVIALTLRALRPGDKVEVEFMPGDSSRPAL